MLSEDGKREWLCPECGNPNIRRTIRYGQSSYRCLDCRNWGPWSSRKTRAPLNTGDSSNGL